VKFGLAVSVNIVMTRNSQRFSRLLFRLAMAAGLLIVLAGAGILGVRWIDFSQPHGQPLPHPASSALDLSGQIVNETGEPIAQARVSARQSGADDGARTFRSNANGRFLLHGIPSGSATLLIVATGYTSQLRDVQVDAQTKPIRIVLSRSLVRRGHVIDSAGKSLADVDVVLIWWRLGPSPFIMATSDADGRFLISDAPADDTTLEVFKDGFKTQTVALAAAPADMVINLQGSDFPIISGHVTDSLTHQAVAQFQVFQGAAFPDSTRPTFHGVKTYGGGSYRLSIDGFGGEVQAYYLRIEADGYRSAISPPLHQSGTLDFALQPAPDWTGHVRIPDGQPAVGARVALIGDEPVIFQDGKLNTDVIVHKPMTARRDGSFQFHQQIDPFELWAWSDAGVAHLQRPEPNGKNLDLTLTPWATLRLKIPWIAGSRLPLTIVAKSPANPVERRWVYSVMPDADGTVVIGRLPPMKDGIAEVQLARAKPQWESGPTVLAHIGPGQTTDLDLTAGVTVTGHVAGDSPILHLSPLPNKPPGQLPTDWLAAAKLMPTVLGYAAKFDSRGHFIIEAVRPGKYAYLAWPDRGNGTSVGCGVLNISAGGNNHAIDMGELSMSKVAPLSNGDPAPPLLGRTLEDKPILTADFHGKFVVWVVLDSLPRSAPALPYLADLGKKFDGDKRVALVGINADVQIGGIARCPPTLGQGWNNGYFSTIDFPLFRALPGSPNWPFILIIGPDGKVVATNLSSREVDGRLNGLLQGQAP
jgi:hypothetical protein